jgi:molybdopterin molybdotransferase
MTTLAAMKSIDQIASELAGYDPKALSVQGVGEFIARLVQPVVQAQDCGIVQALGRVLAADVVSPFNVPPHDNSAMDGFAFDGGLLDGGQSLALKVVGTALAGKRWPGRVGAGECVKIMTGAVMPQGLDTVVPQELTRTEGDLVHIPPGQLQRGDNRRLAGENLPQGRVALAQGELLTPAALGLLASLGIAAVPVWRLLTVAYFSTGDEVLSLGEPPREGAVYDSNRYTVLGMLARLSCQVLDLGVVPDDPALLQAAFARAAREADVIITSGGVSVGEADHTRTMMKQLGDVAFWRIAMRPGRPMAVGRIGNAVLFGLPGNPVAVMVTFLAFVRPALLQMMGCKARPQPLLKAHSLETIRKKPGRTEYQRAVVSTAADGSLQARITGNQGSGVLSSMVQANGLMVLGHDQGQVQTGELVDVMMFDGAI